MKKITLTIILIITLAIFATPILGGFMAERIIKRVTNNINRENANIGADISLEITRYDRNLFSSQIEWKIKSGFLKRLYDIDEVLFTENAKHGFAGIVSSTSLEKNGWFKEFINNRLDGKNPLKVKTKYNYIGNIKNIITTDSFILKEGKEIYNFMPANIYVAFDKKIKNVLIKADFKGLSAADRLILNDISLNLKGKKAAKYIWEDNTVLSVKKIYVKDFNDYFEISDAKLDYSANFDKAKDVLSFKIGSGFESALFEAEKKEEEVKNASLKLEINGVNAKGYNNLIKTYYQKVYEISKHLKKEDFIEEQAIFFGAQMIEAYEKLLKKGLEFKVSDLKAEVKEGKIKGNISLALKKDITLATLFPIIINPLTALDIIDLKSDIILPYKLAMDEQELLYPIYPGMNTGLFVKKGDNLVHNAETKDGKLILNGEELIF
ncbi:MAG: DUF945 family protein [Deltaproteobacteria bacterium]|nr:DUF945 family protein [Deltaproteobacteria bacterium]